MRAREKQQAFRARQQNLTWFADNYQRITGEPLFTENLERSFEKLNDAQVDKIVRDLRRRDENQQADTPRRSTYTRRRMPG